MGGCDVNGARQDYFHWHFLHWPLDMIATKMSLHALSNCTQVGYMFCAIRCLFMVSTCSLLVFKLLCIYISRIDIYADCCLKKIGYLQKILIKKIKYIYCFFFIVLHIALLLILTFHWLKLLCIF